MRKSVFSFAAIAAVLGFASCDNQVVEPVSAPVETPAGDLTVVNFKSNFPKLDRTRATDPIGLTNAFDCENLKLEYAIYETDGTLVKQNSIIKACTGTMPDLNFSEPLRRNHDYKVVAWVTKLNAAKTPVYSFNATAKTVSYDTSADWMTTANYPGVEGYAAGEAKATNLDPKYSDAYIYFGDINVHDGLGAAIDRPITLTRPFCNVVLLSDETIYRSTWEGAKTETVSAGVTRTGGERWSKIATGYNFWTGEVTYKNFTFGERYNAMDANETISQKVTYNSRSNMKVLGNFFMFAPKTANEDASIHFALSEIEGNVPVGANKIIQNSRIIISNKTGTGFFSNHNNFAVSLNVDYASTNDVVGTN